jgi:hypothetical protein
MSAWPGTVFISISDLEGFGIGFGLDSPGPTFAEAGRRGVAVFEELEVGDLAAFRHRFPDAPSRGIGERG